jgi:putative ABC transport system permease protein
LLKNYITIAYRNLLKRKAHSFITVFGLAIALTAFILIMLWVRGELAYDNYNLKADRIYRINTIIKQESGNNLDMAMTALPLAAALQQLPEVENTARLQGPQKNVVVKAGDRIFNEDNFFFADPTVFKVFTIPLLDGNSETVLNYPNSIVLTETMAQKYFGSEKALGKTFSVNYDDQNHDYIITGIMKDLPAESHIHINFLVPLSAVGGDWDKVNCYTYVLMHKNISINKFENQLPEIIKQFMGNDAAVYWSLTAQKLNDIHLHSHRLLEIEPNGDPASICIFSTAGILILLIAVINFISLATAKFADRTREIGVRKVLGAGRNQLIVQFIYENAIIIFISLLFAVSITELLLPFFNNLVHRTVVFTFNSSFLIVAAGLLVISIAASYPAIIFSSMNPALVINKQTKLNPGGNSFRRILVIIQFSIAIALIMCSVIMKEQLNFLLNKNLGIDISNTLLVPLRHTELRDKYPVLKNEFLQLKEVKDISESSNNPANMNPITSLAYGGRTVLEVKSLAVDYNFLKTMGLRLVFGRDFSREILLRQSLLMNQLQKN